MATFRFHGVDWGKGVGHALEVVLALVVVCLVAVAAAGGVSYLAQRTAGREAQEALRELLRASIRIIERQPEPEPAIVVPPPDLRPYLEHLSTMATGMARELAQGISLIVSGPAPTKESGSEVLEAPSESARTEEFPYPTWETDDTWGVQDNQPAGDEWTAEDMAWQAGQNGADTPFGSGGIHLPDNDS